MLSFHFIAALWSPAGKGLTSCLTFVIFNCEFVTFPCGILGQVWYLIVLIPHLCPLSYFYCDWEQQWLCWDCMDTETHLSLCFSLVQQVPKSHVMAHQCRFLMKIFFSSVFWFFTSQSAFFQSCCDRSSWDEPVLSRGSCLAQGHQKILHRKNALGHFQIFYQLIYYDYWEMQNIFDLNIHTFQNSANAESLNVKYLPDEDENSCCVCEASQAGTDLWMGKIMLIELMRIYMASWAGTDFWMDKMLLIWMDKILLIELMISYVASWAGTDLWMNKYCWLNLWDKCTSNPFIINGKLKK